MIEITREECMSLAVARGVLKRLAQKATDKALEKETERMDAFNLGRFEAIATQADDAIFDVLNIAASHLDNENAALWVHARSANAA